MSYLIINGSQMEEHESVLRDQLAEFMPQSVEHHDPCQSNTNESTRYQV